MVASHPRRHSTPSAAVPGVVLCVADGIVRIVARASDDSRGRSRREINLLTGVAAGEEKRCDRDRDAPVGRSFGHHALRSQEVAISLNSAGSTLIRCVARNTRRGWGGSPHYYPRCAAFGRGLCPTMATHNNPLRTCRFESTGFDCGKIGGPPQPYPNARSGLASRPRTVATRHGHYVHVD
jgi:hypothetical protein